MNSQFGDLVVEASKNNQEPIKDFSLEQAAQIHSCGDLDELIQETTHHQN